MIGFSAEADGAIEFHRGEDRSRPAAGHRPGAFLEHFPGGRRQRLRHGHSRGRLQAMFLSRGIVVQRGAVRSEPIAATIDVFAAKLDSSGTLLWNTFLGGTGADDGDGLAVDSTGALSGRRAELVPLGAARSGPIAAAMTPFAAKLDSNGALVWNSFLGGGDGDSGYGIAMDSSGNVFVRGETCCSLGKPGQGPWRRC